MSLIYVNNNHVDEEYDPSFLDTLEAAVRA